MIALATVPVLVGLLLTGFSERIGGRLRPHLAVPLLTVLSLTVALCTGLILSAAALLVCVQWGPLPDLGQWSAHTLRRDMAFPVYAGICALVIVCGLLAAASVRAPSAASSLRSSGETRCAPAAG